MQWLKPLFLSLTTNPIVNWDPWNPSLLTDPLFSLKRSSSMHMKIQNAVIYCLQEKCLWTC